MYIAQPMLEPQGICPKCGYRLSNFKTSARCFNCDYTERGSDGPWAPGITDQGEIWKAESIWDSAYSLSDKSWTRVAKYLEYRRVLHIALTCDQLRHDFGLNRIIPIRSGAVLLARIWHVRKGFVGVHATHLWSSEERGDRCTVGACRGGAVWFGTVTPDTELVVGEGIETTLSAMKLWGTKAGVATLGTAGLKSLVLPQAARHVVIAADNDVPLLGKKIGVGLRDARTARRLWLAEDPTIDVQIKLAPPPKPGEQKRD
jgi:hypothetical protein